jgi:hypothetical protein
LCDQNAPLALCRLPDIQVSAPGEVFFPYGLNVMRARLELNRDLQGEVLISSLIFIEFEELPEWANPLRPQRKCYVLGLPLRTAQPPA